jgi:hypothetical protein
VKGGTYVEVVHNIPDGIKVQTQTGRDHQRLSRNSVAILVRLYKK